MKLIVDFIDKFGGDALYHLGFGALIVALGLPFGWTGVIMAYILMVISSIIKEKYLDVACEWKEIGWACLGGFFIVFYKILLSLF